MKRMMLVWSLVFGILLAPTGVSGSRGDTVYPIVLPIPSGKTCCQIELQTYMSNEDLISLLALATALNAQAAPGKKGVQKFTIFKKYDGLAAIYREETTDKEEVEAHILLDGPRFSWLRSKSSMNELNVMEHEFAHLYLEAHKSLQHEAWVRFNAMSYQKRRYFKEGHFLENGMGHPSDGSEELFASTFVLASLVSEGFLSADLIKPEGKALEYWQWINTLTLFKVRDLYPENGAPKASLKAKSCIYVMGSGVSRFRT
jgi:hypothetical protein